MSTSAWDDTRPPEMDLIKDCVHCGFCLPTCPSYAVFEDEMDSPRGRIVLMRIGHEEGSEVSPEMTDALRPLPRLHGVRDRLPVRRPVRPADRARAPAGRAPRRPHAPRARCCAAGIFALFTHPGRLRAAVPFMALQQRLRLPVPFGEPGAEGAAARRDAAAARGHAGASASARGRVALMQGCVQRVFFGDVNAATVRVLAAEGWEVHAPRRPRCCGALQLHTGVEDEARELARATIDAYDDFDHIVVNVAGCGSAMKEYDYLFEGDERAEAFAAKVRDVHELLAADEPRAERHPVPLKVAYHDACHLAHAQQVRAQPRELLRGIPELELVEPADWELCCGSAGIYNLVQPEPAAELGRRKAANLAATGAEAIAAANPGCAIQIAAHMDGDACRSTTP